MRIMTHCHHRVNVIFFFFIPLKECFTKDFPVNPANEQQM